MCAVIIGGTILAGSIYVSAKRNNRLLSESKIIKHDHNFVEKAEDFQLLNRKTHNGIVR